MGYDPRAYSMILVIAGTRVMRRTEVSFPFGQAQLDLLLLCATLQRTQYHSISQSILTDTEDDTDIKAVSGIDSPPNNH